MEVVTIFLLVSAGFIVGIFFISLLACGERADVTLYESIIMDLHKQLDEANEEITEKLKELLRQVYDILTEAPELNMNNYDEEQVKKLNDKMIEAYYLLNYEQRQFLV